MLSIFSDEHYMRQALQEAQKSAALDEIPVGAIVVCQQQIIARTHNLTEQLNDVTAHAEVLAITAASRYLGNKYLKNCTLYITLEPCVMCAGALAWAQLGKIVIGASDSKRGFRQIAPQALHPKITVVQGVLEPECRQLMQDFFRKKR